jgi:hypothetical protein
MKKINIFYNINKPSEHLETEKKGEQKKDFLDSKKVYERFSNAEISKEVFTALYDKHINQLSDKNKNILSNLFERNFFDKNIKKTIMILKKK